MKPLVIYYSYEGSTEKVAKLIGSTLGADLVSIHVIDDKQKTGASKYLWGGKQVFQKIKPTIKPLNIDINHYDALYIGTPVWASTYAPAIRTLLDQLTFPQKKINVFYTHKGGPGKIEKEFAKELPHNQLCFLSLKNVKKNWEENQTLVKDWLLQED